VPWPGPGIVALFLQKGLRACIKLVEKKKTEKQFADFIESIRKGSGKLGKNFIENGRYRNEDYGFIATPLIITKPRIDEMAILIEKGLGWTETLTKR
jgi:hypothetical protein